MKINFAFICLLVGVVYAEVAIQYKDVIINTHNELRRKQGGNNMNELVWNDQLAQEADAWIGRCRFEHENKGRGENLAFNTDEDVAANVDQAFNAWYDEIKDYNYNTGRCTGVCGHYTQLVWAKTREVGCAMKRCSYLSAFGRNVKNGWIFGCWYTPKGNYVGEKPYLLGGGACSGCLEGQSCSNGLCTGEGKEKCEDKNDGCVGWAASGSCTSNKAYMERECRQSCQFCTGGPKKECKDKNPQCARYGADQCKKNPSWMIPNCMEFCGACEGGKNEDGNEEKMQNDDNNVCKDKNPHCERYGQRECRNNPRWMIPNCRKLCRACEGNNSGDNSGERKENEKQKENC